jgi:hypothetical protein
MAVSPLKDTFEAVMDRQPGTEPKLQVTGQVEVPTTGWALSLKRAHRQGINSRILVLDLIAHGPHGPAGDIVLKSEVQYNEQLPKDSYDEVTIRYEHEAFSIKVPVLV